MERNRKNKLGTLNSIHFIIMKKKHDIRTVEDIQLLVDVFYKKVLEDDLLKDYFKDINWEHHLPVMRTFWENIAFQSGDYSGNPMSLHRHIHQLHPLSPTHFEHWIQHFNDSVDTFFEGSIAEIVKLRAESIAKILSSTVG